MAKKIKSKSPWRKDKWIFFNKPFEIWTRVLPLNDCRTKDKDARKFSGKKFANEELT